MEKSKHARSFKERIKKYTPFVMQMQIYKVIKKARLCKNIFLKKKITKNRIKKVLIKAGLKKGDRVVVHSSLGRMGYVEGGPDTVIDAFLDIIGKKGLLVMPAFSVLSFDKERKIYVFDVKNTPTYTGSIPETFRKRKNVQRSISPTHSYCAFGMNAKEFVKNHENCDNPFSMDGPFGKLYNCNAKIFLVGVDQLANTPLHIVEDKTDFPVKVFTKRFKVLVLNGGKPRIIMARKHLDSLRRHRDPNILEHYCLKHKVMRIYKLGGTHLRVLNAKEFVDMMEELVKRNITIYNVK